jgi:hypothetical protein
MTFFQDDEGHLHGGRLAAVLYTVGLIPGCGSHVFAPLCLSRAVFALGWWIAFCEKRPSRTFSELAHHPHSVVGVTLLISALIAQTYFAGPRPFSGSYSSTLLVLLVGIGSFCAVALYRKNHK